MITKVTKDNHNKYDLLFAAANDVLGFDALSDDAIGSIDEYFQALETITDRSEYATKFIALPLDEPVFEINADTREIKVPSAFSNYGLSVKGDQRAEIVYFAIDRYFDTTDLYKPASNASLDRDEVINIIIQWEVTQSGATKVRGVSKALFQDVEILKSQGKMLFGWAINNQITSYTGSVKFSVRFYSINSDNEVSFSLSTLTATAPIKDGLDFEIVNGSFTTSIYDDSSAVISRLKNSVITDEDKLPLAPEFSFNLSENVGAFPQDDPHYVDLGPTGKYLFKVQAFSTDGGTAKMIYGWTIDGNALTEEERARTSNVTYVETEDTAWNSNKVYYYKETVSGIDSYYVINTSMDFDTAVETYPAIYERFGSFEASRVGEYVAKAINRQKRGGAEGEEGLYSNIVNSDTIIIPGPGELSVTTTAQSVGEDDIYQVCTTLDNEDHPVAELTVIGDTTHTTDGWTVKDKVTYDWSTTDTEYNDNHVEDFMPVTTDANTPNTLTINLGNIATEDLVKYDALYTAEINASRNGVATEVETIMFRVTAPATPFIVERVAAQVRRTGGVATIGVRLANFDDVLHDNIEYKWYHYTSDDVADNDEYIGAGVTAEDGKVCTIDVEDIGSYYCIVTNTVNGTTAVNELDTEDPSLLITVS